MRIRAILWGVIMLIRMGKVGNGWGEGGFLVIRLFFLGGGGFKAMRRAPDIYYVFCTFFVVFNDFEIFKFMFERNISCWVGFLKR